MGLVLVAWRGVASEALQPEMKNGIEDVCGMLNWHLDLELGKKCGRTTWVLCKSRKWIRETISIRREGQGHT